MEVKDVLSLALVNKRIFKATSPYISSNIKFVYVHIFLSSTSVFSYKRKDLQIAYFLFF